MCQDSYSMERENKRFLIALLRFHGDMVLITPLISTIKRLYPHATIDVLVYKGTAKVDGKRMADAEWSATIVDRKQ